ncbi:response regulator transcription factor [Ignatzschineria larvae DSM 13226]|uniref:Response regulator transcription factor n=1 Tax=Ignatzschineria larvae DSM 13226 TaxID=1111732 RepID=A0ABZ3C1T3_9GAMM|nr:response regulator transcription factor [Ignatzschineria larvae]
MKGIQTFRPNVIIVDQNRLFRQKIAFLLSQETRNPCNITASYDSIQSLLQAQREERKNSSHAPNLLLIEARLFENDHHKVAIRQWLKQHPQLKIVLFTENENDHLLSNFNHQAIKESIKKQIETTLFLQRIDRIIKASVQQSKHDNPMQLLTPREEEILNWLVKGSSNKEIARILDISESTVKVHVQNILKKFNVTSRVEAAVYAIRHQLSA